MSMITEQTTDEEDQVFTHRIPSLPLQLPHIYRVPSSILVSLELNGERQQPPVSEKINGIEWPFIIRPATNYEWFGGATGTRSTAWAEHWRYCDLPYQYLVSYEGLFGKPDPLTSTMERLVETTMVTSPFIHRLL